MTAKNGRRAPDDANPAADIPVNRFDTGPFDTAQFEMQHRAALRRRRIGPYAALIAAAVVLGIAAYTLSGSGTSTAGPAAVNVK